MTGEIQNGSITYQGNLNGRDHLPQNFWNTSKIEGYSQHTFTVCVCVCVFVCECMQKPVTRNTENKFTTMHC